MGVIILFGLVIGYFIIEYYKKRTLTSLFFILFICIALLFQMFNIRWGQSFGNNVLVAVWIVFGLSIIMFSYLNRFKRIDKKEENILESNKIEENRKRKVIKIKKSKGSNK